MFAQRGKTGDNECDRKEKEQRPMRNLNHINYNNCGEKCHYAGKNDWPNKDRLKEYEEELMKMNEEKSSNNHPDGGD